jgi:hypothetical protein
VQVCPESRRAVAFNSFSLVYTRPDRQPVWRMDSSRCRPCGAQLQVRPSPAVSGGIWDMAGRAQTVCGPVHPAELGQTLAHEHLLIDLSWSRDP